MTTNSGGPAPTKPKGPSKASKKREYVTKEQVSRMLSVKTELKEFDVTSTAVAQQTVDFNGTIVDMTPIAQGLLESNRIGDRILPVRLKINGIVTSKSAPGNMVRIFVFRWIPNTSSDAPSMGEIFESYGIGSALAPLTNFSGNNRGRFNILWDKVINTQTSVGTATKLFSINLKLAKKPIEFTSSGVTAGQYKIFLGMISDDGVIPYPTVGYIGRFNFTDS